MALHEPFQVESRRLLAGKDCAVQVGCQKGQPYQLSQVG